MKKLPNLVAKNIDQSKAKPALAPNSTNGPSGKSGGNSPADENQPVFKTGVVVALSVKHQETSQAFGNASDQSKKIQPEQAMDLNQSKHLYQPGADQSKVQSQVSEHEKSSNLKMNNITGTFSGLHSKNSFSAQKECNKFLVSDVFKQIQQGEDKLTKADNLCQSDDGPGFNSKRPKLSGPYITFEI